VKSPRCRWTGNGRYRPVRCNLAASRVIFGPRGAAVRCSMHASVATELLARGGLKHATCALPKLTVTA